MTATIQTLAGNLAPNQQRLVSITEQLTAAEGILATEINGVELFRFEEPVSCASGVFEPCICFVIQGDMKIQLGDHEITHSAMAYMASSVHLPVMRRVTEASRERPFIGAKLKVDPQEVANLLVELGDKAPPLAAPDSCPECGLSIAQMDEQMQYALYRLLNLLNSPRDIAILAPSIRREIIYRALIGEMGSRMRQFSAIDSQSHRISNVISILKDQYTKPLRIRELAEAVNMSESTLYHNFKQVTHMSPLQFQKKLRLLEARRLMLVEGIEAATASYRVGYESPSHFSREYSRLFGAPPKADVQNLRGIYAPEPESA